MWSVFGLSEASERKKARGGSGGVSRCWLGSVTLKLNGTSVRMIDGNIFGRDPHELEPLLGRLVSKSNKSCRRAKIYFLR